MQVLLQDLEPTTSAARILFDDLTQYRSSLTGPWSIRGSRTKGMMRISGLTLTGLHQYFGH